MHFFLLAEFCTPSKSRTVRHLPATELFPRPRCGNVCHDIEIQLRFFPLKTFLLECIKSIKHQSCGSEIGKNQLWGAVRQLFTAHLKRRFISRSDELRMIFLQPAGLVLTLSTNEHLD